MDAMTAAQISQAKGIKYLVVRGKDGKFKRIGENALDAANEAGDVVEMWEKDPSIQAYTDLMNRALDKPAEQEQAVEHKGTIVLRHELG